MESHIIWKKKWFGNVHELYSRGMQVGSLTSKTFSYNSFAEYGKHRIRFQTNGFIKQETSIISEDSNTVIGTITYNTMKSKGTIKMDSEHLEWRSVNWTNSRWEILKDNEIIISSSNRMLDGSIISKDENPIQILIGLYISEFFNRSNVAVFMAIFIIFITALN